MHEGPAGCESTEMPQVIVSASARLRPAPTIAVRIQCQGHSFVAASLIDATGKPIEVPRSAKPSKGLCVAGVLLLCDDEGALELPKVRALATTLQILPRDGTGGPKPRQLPRAQTGAHVEVTLHDLHQGFVVPLDLPGAGAKKLAAFELTFVVNEAPFHKCC